LHDRLSLWIILESLFFLTGTISASTISKPARDADILKGNEYFSDRVGFPRQGRWVQDLLARKNRVKENPLTRFHLTVLSLFYGVMAPDALIVYVVLPLP
jgi:hypothetical protein